MAGELIGVVLGNALSLGATALVAWAGYGWINVARTEPPTPWIRTLSVGLIGLCAVLAVRQFYWGVVWEVLNSRWIWTWENMVFDSVTMVSALVLLRARWLLIPDFERDRWTWLTAPLFPPGRCIVPWHRLRRRKP